jgi:hypothetical protein
MPRTTDERYFNTAVAVRNEPGFTEAIQHTGVTTDDDVAKAILRLPDTPEIVRTRFPESIRRIHEMLLDL